jgi:hypothetical protein
MSIEIQLKIHPTGTKSPCHLAVLRSPFRVARAILPPASYPAPTSLEGQGFIPAVNAAGSIQLPRRRLLALSKANVSLRPYRPALKDCLWFTLRLSRITAHESPVTTPRFSNRHIPLLEFAATPSKQRTLAISNRHRIALSVIHRAPLRLVAPSRNKIRGPFSFASHSSLIMTVRLSIFRFWPRY